MPRHAYHVVEEGHSRIYTAGDTRGVQAFAGSVRQRFARQS